MRHHDYGELVLAVKETYFSCLHLPHEIKCILTSALNIFLYAPCVKTLGGLEGITHFYACAKIFNSVTSKFHLYLRMVFNNIVFVDPNILTIY